MVRAAHTGGKADLRIIRRINYAIKHRDFWMPFAPSILEEHAGDYLRDARPARYMIEAFDTNPINLTISPNPGDLILSFWHIMAGADDTRINFQVGQAGDYADVQIAVDQDPAPATAAIAAQKGGVFRNDSIDGVDAVPSLPKCRAVMTPAVSKKGVEANRSS